MDTQQNSIMKTLKRSDVFLGLEDKYLERIATLPSLSERNLESGEILFQSGERATCLYVIKEGNIDLVAGAAETEKGKQKVIVDKVTTGSLLGWSAVVAPFSYIFSAVADTPSIVICINGRELMSLSNEDNYIGYRVFNGISRIVGSRLRDYEQILLKGRRWPFLKG